MTDPLPLLRPVPAVCRLVLFVAGHEGNSRLARKNLQEIRADELGGRCDAEVVDVLQDASLALKHDILVTPTLLVLSARPPTMIVGNLNDRAKVRAALSSSGSR